MPGKLDIKLSQRKLVFQLPFTNANVEDAVEVKNTLPKITDNAKENIVSFKAFSVVRDKYSMNPSTGFIGAGESVVLTFSLETEYIRKYRALSAPLSEIPEKEDTIYLFFVAVPVSTVNAYLSSWDSRGPLQNTPAIQQAAKAFWTTCRGAGTPVSTLLTDEAITRKRLKCIFEPREPHRGDLQRYADPSDAIGMPLETGQLQESRPTIQPNGVGAGSALGAGRPSVPQPAAQKPPLSEGGGRVPNASHVANPAASTSTSLIARGIHDTLKNSFDNRTAHNAGGASDTQWALSTIMVTLSSLFEASMFITAPLPPMRKVLRTIFHYRIPYALVIVLLVLSFLCGAFERGTFFSWLVTGK